MRGMGPPVSSLLAVQLDDELLGHGDLDVVAERQAAHGPLLLVGVDLQPLGHLAAARVQVVVQARHELRGRPKLDHIPHLHQVRRHRDLPAVHLEVAVRAHLPPPPPPGRETEHCPASYPRRRFGGRHPSCGIGVTSRIAVISRPTAWSERMAASRPAPGPRTKTSTCLSPYSIALRAATSAAVCAANGVLLREPRKPALPELDQATTLPIRSVSVTIVLLKVAWMCAMPVRTSRRSRFLPPFLRGVGFCSSAMPYAPAFFGAGAAGAAVAGFFFTITPRRGPFRVRAFVCVRWPRTGRPRRWRIPR